MTSCLNSITGIAVAGEEAKNPAKSIPIATCLAMTIVTLLYMGNRVIFFSFAT